MWHMKSDGREEGATWDTLVDVLRCAYREPWVREQTTYDEARADSQSLQCKLGSRQR